MNDFEEKINQAREKILNTMGAEKVEEWLNCYKPNPDYLRFDPTKNISDSEYGELTYQIDSQFNDLSNAISEIENGNIGTYTASDFIKCLVYYQDLLNKRDLIERNQQEKETVKKIFGSFDNYTFDKPSGKNKGGAREKTVEELEQERNERLAMLGELRANGEISNQQFLDGAMSLRHVYERETQNKQVNDIVKQENEIKKNPSVIRKFTDKLKRLFKTEKSKTAQTTPGYENELINQNAREALVYASKLLEYDPCLFLSKPTQSAAGIDVDYQTMYQKERIDLLNESADIPLSSAFRMNRTNEFADIISSLYSEEYPKCQTEQDKENLTFNILNIGTCFRYKNGHSVLKTQEELSDEKSLVSDKLLELLGGQNIYVANENRWTVAFKNDKDKQKYYETINQYDILSDEISKREPYKNAVKDMTENLKEEKQHSK